MHRKSRYSIAFLLVLAALTIRLLALTPLEQIPLKTFEAMKDVERYQIRIAEKHYTNSEFKFALDEYEKFLTFYPKSTGAPYAQLMWSHTMMHLKKPQTALREGFQSVIDYWLESHEATIAAYRQIDRFPDNCFRMAGCHRKLGEQQEAIVLYNQCKVVDQAAPEASLQIGFTYEEAKDKEKAIRTFQLTCKRYPKAGQAGQAHAHLQNVSNISVTLGGTEAE